jgi:hypothetical protein
MGKYEELVAKAQIAIQVADTRALENGEKWHTVDYRGLAQAAVSAVLAGLKDTSPEYLRALEAEGVSFATYNRVMEAMPSAFEPGTGGEG